MCSDYFDLAELPACLGIGASPSVMLGLSNASGDFVEGIISFELVGAGAATSAGGVGGQIARQI